MYILKNLPKGHLQLREGMKRKKEGKKTVETPKMGPKLGGIAGPQSSVHRVLLKPFLVPHAPQLPLSHRPAVVVVEL